MKKVIGLICVMLTVLIFSGCTSFETNRAGNNDYQFIPVIKPDIEVSKDKITGKSNVNCLFGIFTWGVNKEAAGVDFGSRNVSMFGGANTLAKNGAAYDACNKANADILVAPRYDITTQDYFVFKKIDCEVKGFPGKLNSIEVQK